MSGFRLLGAKFRHTGALAATSIRMEIVET